MSSKFEVKFVNYLLESKGRPTFFNSTKMNVDIDPDTEDKRHILHSNTQIIASMIGSFNRIIVKEGNDVLEEKLDKLLEEALKKGVNFKLSLLDSLEAKAAMVIRIAFSKDKNLVAGYWVENQGIEVARNSINDIKKQLDKYCTVKIRSFDNIQSKILGLIDTKLKFKTSKNKKKKIGIVAVYKNGILKLLAESVKVMTTKSVEKLNRLLTDFEFSCTLDILHDKVSREQNIWGITMARRLQNAICNENEEKIFKILL